MARVKQRVLTTIANHMGNSNDASKMMRKVGILAMMSRVPARPKSKGPSNGNR